jgi:hypothetical protein
MEDATFQLELADGFIEGPSDEPGDLFVYTQVRHALKEAQLWACDANGAVRFLVPVTRKTMASGGVAFSTERQRVFFSAENAVWEWPLQGGEAVRILSPGIGGIALVDEPTGLLWSFVHRWDPEPKELVAIDLERREIVRRITLRGFPPEIALSLKSGVVARVDSKGEAEVLSLEGRSLASLALVPTGKIINVSIRDEDGAVLLSGPEGLSLWRWREGKPDRLSDSGTHARFGPSGDVFFMRGSSELWRWRDGVVERLARAISPVAGFLPGASWLRPPTVSNDGRFLLAFVAATRDREIQLAGLLFDLRASTVVQVPWMYPFGMAWLR